MTARIAPPAPLEPDPPFLIRRTLWGWTVHGAGGSPMLMQVAQGVTLAFGAALTAGALALVLARDEPLDATRAGLGAALVGLSLLLVWFATRGGVVELQFDLARGELRELVRHRVGRASLVGRHDLSGPLRLLVDRPRHRGGDWALVLFARDGEGLCIAEGPEDAVLELRRRLEPELRGLLDQPPSRTAA